MFASVLVTLLLVEVVLHQTRLEYRYIHPEPQGYLRFDPELGFDITPNFATSTHNFYDLSYPVSSNSLGCFDDPYRGETPYIYITGDSFTWGYAPLEDKWGKGIEQETGVRTLTCGVANYGTRQEVIKTSRDLARLPQPPQVLVVGYFGSTDVGDDFIYPRPTVVDGYRVPSWSPPCTPEEQLAASPLATTTCLMQPPRYSFLQKVKLFFATHSIIFMILRDIHAVDALRAALAQVLPHAWLVENGIVHDPVPVTEVTATSTDEAVWQADLHNMSGFEDLAAMYHTKLVVVLIPDGIMAQASSTDPAWPNERMKAFLDSQHIDYVDLLPEFRAQAASGTSLFWSFDGHFNIAGNHLAGQIVSQYLIDHHIIGKN
jgi:hypothetical protein